MKHGLIFPIALIFAAAWAQGATVKSAVADAAMRGDKQAVRELVRTKADVNVAQTDGTTALHWAAQADDLELADLLIKAGAKVSAANIAGATPLQLAAVNGRAAMLDRLITAGADPNASLTRSGDTALMMASRTGKLDAVRTLLTGERKSTRRKPGAAPVPLCGRSRKSILMSRAFSLRVGPMSTRDLTMSLPPQAAGLKAPRRFPTSRRRNSKNLPAGG